MSIRRSTRPRKRFGQNFLTDQGVIQAIIHSIRPKPEDRGVEIGPGLGALTEPLLLRMGRLTVIELDRDLVPALMATPGLRVIAQDALRVDYSELVQDKPIRLVGNLPYNISTPLLFHVLHYADVIEDMHFMLQQEVVDRLAAKPGCKANGRLSIMVQYQARVESVLQVPPTAFDPMPKVNSAVVRLIPHQALPHPAQDENLLRALVAMAFSQRRKVLRNNLKSYCEQNPEFATVFDLSQRAEDLGVAEFVAMSNWLAARNV